MKEIIGLLWAICIVVITIYFHVNGSLGKVSTGLFCVVAIGGGLVIAKYDSIYPKRIEVGGIKLEMARQEIATAKSEALTEIKKEVEAHKESITMLIRTGNELSNRLESQKSIVNAMIQKAQSIETQLQEDQRKLEDVKGDVVLAHRNSQAIFNATKELSLILARITFVQAKTKSEFGNTPRLKKAAEVIEKDINRVLHLMVPDPKERSKFVEELTNVLPSR